MNSAQWIGWASSFAMRPMPKRNIARRKRMWRKLPAEENFSSIFILKTLSRLKYCFASSGVSRKKGMCWKIKMCVASLAFAWVNCSSIHSMWASARSCTCNAWRKQLRGLKFKKSNANERAVRDLKNNVVTFKLRRELRTHYSHRVWESCAPARDPRRTASSEQCCKLPHTRM